MNTQQTTPALPTLLVRLWDARENRYSPLHGDPCIGPAVAHGKAIYEAESRQGFERASVLGRAGAIRFLLNREAANAR